MIRTVQHLVDVEHDAKDNGKANAKENSKAAGSNGG